LAFTIPNTNQQPAKPKSQPCRHLGHLQCLPPTNNLQNQKANHAGILGLYNAYHQPTTCKTKKPTMHLGPLQRLPPTNNLPYQKTNQASWAFTMPTTNQQPAKPKKTFIWGLYNAYHQPTTC
jgi:hypothetical protein